MNRHEDFKSELPSTKELEIALAHHAVMQRMKKIVGLAKRMVRETESITHFMTPAQKADVLHHADLITNLAVELIESIRLRRARP